MNIKELHDKIISKARDLEWYPELYPYEYEKGNLLFRFRKSMQTENAYYFVFLFPPIKGKQETIKIGIHQSQEDEVFATLTYGIFNTRVWDDFDVFFKPKPEDQKFKNKYQGEFPEGNYTNNTLLYLMEDLLKIDVS